MCQDGMIRAVRALGLTPTARTYEVAGIKKEKGQTARHAKKASKLGLEALTMVRSALLEVLLLSSGVTVPNQRLAKYLTLPLSRSIASNECKGTLPSAKRKELIYPCYLTFIAMR